MTQLPYSLGSTFTKSGFSLVEVALALALAAFALLAIFSLLPVGMQSNMTSVEETKAASIARAIVADLEATPKSSSQTAIYDIPIPSSSTAVHALFLHEDGSPAASTASGALDAKAIPAQNPWFRATLSFSAPTSANPMSATSIRILIAWPALADPNNTMTPTNFSGSYEVLAGLDRN